jgi:serine phosphatase RsbU (regulator of sigma subunit)
VPLGLGHLLDRKVRPAQENLEPGDRLLLYTDGVTEARDVDGAEFGVERLIDLTERHADSGLPPPETLRRVSHAVLEHQGGRLQDDATLLLLEWTAEAQADVVPRTA